MSFYKIIGQLATFDPYDDEEANDVMNATIAEKFLGKDTRGVNFLQFRDDVRTLRPEGWTIKIEEDNCGDNFAVTIERIENLGVRIYFKTFHQDEIIAELMAVLHALQWEEDYKDKMQKPMCVENSWFK